MKIPALVLAAALALAGCDFSVQPPASPQASAGAGATAAPMQPREAVPLPDFTTLMKRDGPAVVNIISTNKAAPAARRGQPPQAQQEEDPMLEFFRRFIPDMPPGGPNAQPRAG